MKKIISCMLVIAMMATMAVAFSGCGGGKGPDGVAEGTFSVFGYAINADRKEVCEAYQAKWEANCEYPVEWIAGDMDMIMNSGQYPDIILKTQFQNEAVANYASQGILLDLTPYLTPENAPNILKMFEEIPSTKAIATSPDGGIYALPSYGGNKGSLIETCWWINDEWLKKGGFSDPTNLDELYEVLKYFKENDMNGNGDPNDEIPFTFMNSAAYSYPETLLSCWGVSTKFGMYDQYLNVQNGKVNFTPVMDEWKEMIRFYAKLYEEGILDKQCITYESAAWSSTMKASTPIVGCTFGKENPFGDNADQYKVLLPLRAHADSPDPIMHIHPGSLGTRNACHVTVNCEDPEAAVRWIDTFYSKEATIENWYGEKGTSFLEGEENYKWVNPADLGYDSIAEMYGMETFYGPHMLGYMDLEADIEAGIIEDCEEFQTYRQLLADYEPYLDKETWPRPYYDPADSKELTTIQTDLFNVVEQYKADWIMGRKNVDETWDQYMNELKNLKVDRFIEINQEAYDVFNESLNSIEQ